MICTVVILLLFNLERACTAVTGMNYKAGIFVWDLRFYSCKNFHTRDFFREVDIFKGAKGVVDRPA